MLVIACAIFALNRSDSGKRYQRTDDAYIRADFTMVAPQISGRIVEVAALENRPVERGDLLFAIDGRDYALQVENAQAQLGVAEAGLESIRQQIAQQDSVITQARAQVEADEASLALARLEYERYRGLASQGASSRQLFQQAEADYKVARATMAQHQAKYESEILQLQILQAEGQKSEATVNQARAGLELAELNLSYCRVAAPISGTVSQQSARIGAYAQAGQALLAVVPLRDIYIDAYFRETQLANIKVGQPVKIGVDAAPGRTFKGVVASLGPASNASFSSIAPHSTSSNFTKIVQRLPVRIAITDEDMGQLKVGMSVQPEIDTGS